MNQKTLICDECLNEFSLKAVGIQYAEVKVNDQQLTLIYFACTKCNKIYRVSLQDARYTELKEDLERIKMRIRRNRGGNNEELLRQLNSMMQKKQERFDVYVEKLNKKFNGTFTFVVSENNSKGIKYLP